MNRLTKLWLLHVLATILLIAAGAGAPEKSKKLIEFGWDEPDTGFLRKNVRTMETTPFDGCVFHAIAVETGGKTSQFGWQAWGRRSFTIDELQPAIDDLKATRFERFTDNFLRFNTTPADLDWFDDFASILNNARLAARIAHEGKCRGILFDTESYQGKLFDYHKQRDATTKTWPFYAAQARLRGREVMVAFQQEYPDVTILLTFGPSYPWKQTEGGKTPLPDAEDGLLAPFVSGMAEALNGKSRLVDAHELSYGYRDLEKFDKARKTILEGVLPIVEAPESYRKNIKVGFGLWLDYDWPKYGWNDADTSKNYFTPRALVSSLGSEACHLGQIHYISAAPCLKKSYFTP